jgi:hypothetical protein
VNKTIIKQEPPTLKKLPIIKLVPGEPILSRESIDKYKNLKSGATKPPRVVTVGEVFYVTNGNHRVMAAKELGQIDIECEIRPPNTRTCSADFDQDDCKRAIRLGLQGFEGIRIVPTDAEKEKACAEENEDDAFFDDLELE